MYWIHHDKVVNRMNRTGLKSFRISGLFGRYDVDLDFEKEVNIFIGENGLGKTTILNCLYYVLEKKFVQLGEVHFDSIEIAFHGGKRDYVISKADVLEYNRRRDARRVHYDDEYFEYLFSDLNVSVDSLENLSEDDLDYWALRIAAMQDMPIHVAKKRLYMYLKSRAGVSRMAKGNEKNVTALVKGINENINENVVYLPTYRRIENDFSSLRIRNEEINNSEMLIRFGMSDVQKAIDGIISQIRDLAVEGYDAMTGILLEQYITPSSIASVYPSTVDKQDVKIALDRLGNKINDGTKEKILQMIESKEIYSEEYLHLLNLLHKLISNYDRQKELDDRIKSFAMTCNKYLRGKRFEYNPSELTLEIIVEDVLGERRIVKLTQLSSGEKQIVSLFSKLYLENDGKNIVIIDEPELSLSIAWQQMLLPDVMRSKNCALLLTVTHSPFIFENEFDMDAREIRAYMSQV